jgi:hypothetical protein
MRFCFVVISRPTEVVLLLKLGENEVCLAKKSGQKKVGAGFKPAPTSVPSHKIAFLFGKAQGLQEERSF